MNITELIKTAREASKNAYYPHSNFPVGAAILCTDGTYVVGCNVENASYGLTICAERNALFSMVAQGKSPVVMAVSVGKNSPDHYKMPCGACRQVIIELMGDAGTVYVDGVGSFLAEDLLPHAFRI